MIAPAVSRTTSTIAATVTASFIRVFQKITEIAANSAPIVRTDSTACSVVDDEHFCTSFHVAVG